MKLLISEVLGDSISGPNMLLLETLLLYIDVDVCGPPSLGCDHNDVGIHATFKHPSQAIE
jgi:hypothetical protein